MKGQPFDPLPAAKSPSHRPFRPASLLPLPWLILAFGFVLRLAPYLGNRSLWHDEAALALNVTGRTYSQLLQPLDYDQGAPPGFVLLEHLAVDVFGDSEYALRLVPFLSGVAALFLFLFLARRYIGRSAVPIALCLFAVSGHLIYYSTELKQYSSDTLMTVLLLLAAMPLLAEQSNRRHMFLFGILGAAVLWISHPSVFVFVGIGFTLVLFSVIRKNRSGIHFLSMAAPVWALSLAICYIVSLRDLSQDKFLAGYWASGFMPFPPFSLTAVKWFDRTFFEIFTDPVGLPLAGLGALAFFAGLWSMWRTSRQKAVLLLAPLGFALAASALHKYPFRGRLLLFAVPVLILFIGEGTHYVYVRTRNGAAIIGVAFIALLLFHPVGLAVNYLLSPREREEIKPVLEYVKSHRRDGEPIYVYYGAEYAFRYYAPRYGVAEDDWILGRRETARRTWAAYEEGLERIRGREKVWVLFAHVYYWGDINEEKLFLYFLDKMGRRLDSARSEGASVYVYDLSADPERTDGEQEAEG